MRPQKITRPSFDIEVFSKAWNEAGITQRIEILNRVTPQKTKLLRDCIPELLTRETNPGVATALIRLFRPVWPQEDLKPLFARLNARQVSLRMTALEALIHLSPGKLSHCLPELLKARDSRIRLLAFQGLARIDMSAAIRHLENLLLQGNPTQKKIGLQGAILLPFDQVRTLLLKVFAAERDPAVLNKVGAILLANPDPEVPYHLWEITENLPPETAAIGETIRQRLLLAIEKSGILDEDYSEYRCRLEAWIRRRAILRAIREAMVRFSADDGFSPAAVAAHLNPFREREEFAEIIGMAIKGPIPEAFRRVLSDLLKPEQPSLPVAIAGADTGAGETTTGAIPPWSDCLTDSDKLRFLADVTHRNRDELSIILSQLIGDSGTKGALKIAAIRAAAQIRCPDFCDHAEKWAAGPDSGLAFAALEYLTTFRATRTQAILLAHVRQGPPRKKAGAFRLLCQHFPKKALEEVLRLLEADHSSHHEIALTGAAFLDFALTRDGLTSFLLRTPQSPLYEKCLFLFQSNPDFNNLYSFYKLIKMAPAEHQEKLEEVRNHTIEFLARFGRLKVDLLPEFTTEFAAMWEHEQAQDQNGEAIGSPPAPQDEPES
jgi:hypothetical protein